MKNILLLKIFILQILFLNAQDCITYNSDDYGSDSVNCRKNLSLYTGYLTQKNFIDAAIFWSRTQSKCPSLKPNLYANGAYIYKQIIKEKVKSKSSDLGLYRDTLYQIYDQWFTNFGQCNSIKVSLAKDIIITKDQKKFPKSYSLYKEVMENEPMILKSSDIKYFFVYTGIYMIKAGKIDCEEFLSNYEALSTICENNISLGNNPEKFSNVQNILDKKLGETSCASCDKLEQIYTSKYNSDPENMVQVRKIFSSLSNNKCTESSLYLTLLEKVLNDPENPPTAKDLFNAAYADYRRNDFKKSVERFDRALAISQDDILNRKINEILFDISFTRKQFKKGFEIAGRFKDKCVSNDKKARIIAASSSVHGNSTLDKSLIYCLALNYSSSSCGKTPSNIVNGWKSQLLPKSELIMLDIASGSKQNVPFWGQTVELKTRD